MFIRLHSELVEGCNGDGSVGQLTEVVNHETRLVNMLTVNSTSTRLDAKLKASKSGNLGIGLALNSGLLFEAIYTKMETSLTVIREHDD